MQKDRILIIPVYCSLQRYGDDEMNIDDMQKCLLGIPNVEMAESAHGSNRIFTFG